MSEPTIDEMLGWVVAMDQNLAGELWQDSRVYASRAILQAIRAVLEQQRDTPKNLGNVLTGMLGRETQLEAIRAFVERVKARQREADMTTAAAIDEELAAMEQEVQK